MYESFFELTRPPFSVVPDPDCLHLTGQHSDAINGLAYGIMERKGYLMLTGEAGLGKTTALRVLAQILAESDVLASIIVAPTLTPPEFLEMAMYNFGFKEVPASKAQRLRMLEQFLLKSDADGKIVALIVDEAHQLSPEVLEEIRLLGNFEATDRKLLQIVLVGQNQLDQQLNLPELWQLKQRITLRLSLRRLDRDGVANFVRFRWEKAGGKEPNPFNEAAMEAVAVWSGGVPRLVNVICDNALLVAFSESSRRVDLKMVREACVELSLPTPVFAQKSRSATEERPAAQPEPKPDPPVETPPKENPSNGWAEPQPSLLKRWFRFSHQQQPLRSKTGILLLKEP